MEGSSSAAVSARGPALAQARQLAIVDTDVHNISHGGALLPYLPERWRHYYQTWGTRTRHEADTLPALRPQAQRYDAVPPCGIAGGDPAFAAEQHLDAFDIDIAILNSIPGQITHSGGNTPVEFAAALERANNDWTMEQWLDADPRWRASIAIQYDTRRMRYVKSTAASRWMHGSSR